MGSLGIGGNNMRGHATDRWLAHDISGPAACRGCPGGSIDHPGEGRGPKAFHVTHFRDGEVKAALLRRLA